jgi:RNA polymerase sigma-70 factor (ECF subfamily)
MTPMTPGERKEIDSVFNEAYHDHQKGLSARALFKVSDKALSKDLVQDTFTKTWAYLVKGGKIETMRAFLYKILNNLIIDEYRKKTTAVSLDELMQKGFEPSIDERDRLGNTLDGRALFLLIQKLPVKYREVIFYRFAKDLSIKEIAKLTNKNTNTVTVQIHRGLGKLKALYEENNNKTK